MDRKSRAVEQTLAVVVVGLLLVGCFLVLRPFISALIWAAILCFATWPVYTRLHRLLKGRRTLAAACMTALVALVLLGPFAFIGARLAGDVTSFADASRHQLEAGLPGPPAWVSNVPFVGERTRVYWQSLVADRAKLLSESKRILEPVTGWLLVVGFALVRGLAELGMSILIAFFLYRDGLVAAERLTAAVERLAGDDARSLVALAANTVRGVVYGILGTALGQAIVAAIGFVIAGIPRPGLLALLTFFLSVVPMGPPLVWIPACIWCFYQGSVGWGIFMAVWGVLISSVDNVIKPMIISQGSPIPFILILFGVLGGATAFGFIGVFIGPTLLAVGFRLLEQWNAGRRAAEKIVPPAATA
jgi:predicted PurR-regulated permease PerM